MRHRLNGANNSGPVGLPVDIVAETSRYSTLKHLENVFWSYLAEFAESRGAPPKQSCQEWYEVREITRDSAWGRLPDGNVVHGSIRTLLLHSS